jgi:predicted TIM-barrel fold metal-dependent hydrolase
VEEPTINKVVDADGHVVEPVAAWAEIPTQMRPTFDRDQSGYEHVVVGGQEILAAPLGTLATPGSRFWDPNDFRSLDQAQPGGSDPGLRLADMDAEGIDQSVLYPSIGLYFWALSDPKAASAIARAYNDWLASYCAACPTRLFGAAMLPFQDPVTAAAELRRASTELGFPAAFVRPNPCCGRSLSDRAYDAVWEAAVDTETTIGVHEGSSVLLPTLGSDRPFNPLVLHAVSHSFEEMLACAQLISFGTFERFPDLRVVFLESGGGWAPFWLERLDEQAESFGGFCPELLLKPSEYFARQCWISFEIEERTLPVLAPFIGSDKVVWGSDYPHHDATFPGALESLYRTISPMEAEAKAKVLGDNAAALYRLPEPEVRAPGSVVHAYFAAVRDKDGVTMRRLFEQDAELVASGSSVVGREAIAAFYEQGAFNFADLDPNPGSLQLNGSRVDVEIDLQMNGQHHRVTDTFELAGSRIKRLEITFLS